MKIIKSFRKTISLKIDNSWELIIKAPFFTSKKYILDFVSKNKDWLEKRQSEQKNKKTYSEEEILVLKQKAKDYIIERTKFLASKNNLSFNSIKITSAKTRWWSCSSKKNLNFSYRLILCPKEVIDYVIIHELAHLSEMNHSKKFRQKVESMDNDYILSEKWLKQNWNKI